VDSIIKSAAQKTFILSIFDTPLLSAQSTIHFFLTAISAALLRQVFFCILLRPTKVDKQMKDYEPV